MSKSPPMPSKGAAPPALPDQVQQAVTAALDKKAVDLVVLDLRKASAFTDFFVICTGTNVKQVKAIADAVERALREQGLRPAVIEGIGRAEWVLIDYFDFILHIFTPATRTFYDLERLWGDAEKIEISA